MNMGDRENAVHAEIESNSNSQGKNSIRAPSVLKSNVSGFHWDTKYTSNTLQKQKDSHILNMPRNDDIEQKNINLSESKRVDFHNNSFHLNTPETKSSEQQNSNFSETNTKEIPRCEEKQQENASEIDTLLVNDVDTFRTLVETTDHKIRKEADETTPTANKSTWSRRIKHELYPNKQLFLFKLLVFGAWGGKSLVLV